MSKLTLGYPAKYGGELEIELSGMDLVAENMTRFMDKVPEACGEALHEFAAERIMPLARERVPVLTGELMASSHLEQPTHHGNEVHVTMGFGGPPGIGNLEGETNAVDVDYAVYVHEDLMKAHHGGQAKFLESAIVDTVPDMMASLVEKVTEKTRDAS